MFCDCKLFKSLDLSHFISDYTINMSGLFSGCNSLKDVNLSNLNTENVFNMRRMF